MPLTVNALLFSLSQTHCTEHCQQCITLDQFRGLQVFLSEGHISCYTTVRGPDILCNVIVSGYVAFCQINMFSENILGSIIGKMSLHLDENGFTGQIELLSWPCTTCLFLFLTLIKLRYSLQLCAYAASSIFSRSSNMLYKNRSLNA